jgi:hypothetical protein
MFDNIKNGLKIAYDKINKIPPSRIKLLIKTIGAVGGLYVSYHAYAYYKDATRDDAKSRAYAISHSMLHKQYDSVRVKDVELIKDRLTLKPIEIHNKFTVLIGPRGIGKTVAIESAAQGLNGIAFEN